MQWDFEKDGHALKARVEGQWTFNSSIPILRAAVAGCGLAYLPQDMMVNEVANGTLVRVLDDGCQPFAGYHLYSPTAASIPLRSGSSSMSCAIGVTAGDGYTARLSIS
ncbi:LysR substrate binding domain protein [compost metagenome]|jgi:DNA-binding transcriptional LysR family regulator